MTSINTNIAAQTALRTLQSTNAQLDQTQSRISTGLKIGEAKDNAAYWSISTTLRSDNKALGTVKDALSLGAATVDTAYQGLNQALNVLDEIKSKLAVATGQSNKDAIQSEIAELQKQLMAIAGTSAFSGANWLSVNSGDEGYASNKSVVSSFSRDASGAVTLGTIGIDTNGVALFDSNTASATRGLLDTAAVLKADGKEIEVGGNTLGNLNVGGLSKAEGAAGAVTVQTAAAAATSVTFAENDTFTFNVALNGSSVTKDVTVTKAIADKASAGGDGILNTREEWTAAVQAALDEAKLDIKVSNNGAADATLRYTFTSTTKGADADIVISAGSFRDDSAGTDTPTATFNTSAAGTAADRTFGKAAATVGSFTGSMVLDSDDKVSFKLTYDGVNGRVVTIDKAAVSEALSTTDGRINGSDDFAKVLSFALASNTYTKTLAGANGGVADTDVKVSSVGGKIVFESQDTSKASAVQISDVKADAGESADGSKQNKISVVDIDISRAMLAERGVTDDKFESVVKAYINVVNAAIDSVTSAASNLGSVGKRIELQQSFVSNLMDTIDAGISGLVDADMNEESTRLQALQVKQQLGVQALSIANQSAQNVLRLFQ